MDKAWVSLSKPTKNTISLAFIHIIIKELQVSITLEHPYDRYYVGSCDMRYATKLENDRTNIIVSAEFEAAVVQ